MEEYKGVKFRLVPLERALPRADVAAFLSLDRSLSAYIHPEKNEGNLSIRVEGGFLIKRTGAKLTTCTEKDVVLVVRAGRESVSAAGGTPSSESRMHGAVYRRRKDANAILHFHDDKLLSRPIGVAVGPFLRYGTEALATAVARACVRSDLVRILGHGLVIVGRDGKDILEKLGRLYG
jgi:L-fuculose-phosphate aldolase